MNAPGAPRHLQGRQPMLVLDPQAPGEGPFDRCVADLPGLLGPGDLVVINDAATMPASLDVHRSNGAPVELRLVGQRQDESWDGILMGPGGWRIDTDIRPAVEGEAGERLWLADGSQAHVVHARGRLVRVSFEHHGDNLWAYLFQHGRPIQYRYADRELTVADVQTPWATRPVAVEMPSAARPLNVQTLLAIRHAGADVVRLTHAAGISSTGSLELDDTLPFNERYQIPAATAEALERTQAGHGRVLAIGTSVVRALEGAATTGAGRVRPGADSTDLVIRAGFVPRVVDGLLTGVHEPGTSHYDVMAAFAPRSQVDAAAAHAAAHGYGIHEFGDSTLVLPGAARHRSGPAYWAA